MLSLSFSGLVLEYWRTPLRRHLIAKRKQMDTFVKTPRLKTSSESQAGVPNPRRRGLAETLGPSLVGSEEAGSAW